MDIINRLLTAPKHIFLHCLELIILAIMAETFIKRDQLTYFQLLLLIDAIISLSKLKVYFHKHYLEREWDTAYRLLSNKTKKQFKKQCGILNVIVVCYFVVCREIHMNRPNAVYCILISFYTAFVLGI